MLQKKKTEKTPGKPEPVKPQRVEHDQEPPASQLSAEEEFDKLPEEDDLETPPYEQPPAGEGP